MSRWEKGERTGVPDSCTGIRVDTPEGLQQLREQRGVGPDLDGLVELVADRIAAIRRRGLSKAGESEWDGPSPWRIALAGVGGDFDRAADVAVVGQALQNVRERAEAPRPPRRKPQPRDERGVLVPMDADDIADLSNT